MANYSINTMPGYMGATGYRGSNAFRNLYGADLSKAIREALKAEKVKGVTVKVSTYTGGQSITLTIKAAPTDYMPIADYLEIVGLQDFAPFNWIRDPDTGKDVSIYDAYDWPLSKQEHVKTMLAVEHMRNFRTGKQQLNHYYLDRYNEFKPEFLEKLRRINQIVTSFNYDESNSMVDYFDCGFYAHWYIKNEEV